MDTETRDLEGTRRLIVEIANEYQVARNFPKLIDGIESNEEVDIEDPRRLRSAAKIFRRWRRNVRNPYAVAVADLSDRLTNTYGQGSLSAASKFAWFYLRESRLVKIYDSRAVSGLRRLGQSLPAQQSAIEYGDFVLAWNRAYRSNKESVAHALERLGAAAEYSYNGASSANQISELVRNRWFAQRVFDRYLWNIGQEEPT
jgi:hypothetical protein